MGTLNSFGLCARVATAFFAALIAVFGILGSTASFAQSGRLLQVSTRGQVLTGDDVMIAGFVISGSTPKTVVINVAGPSLASELGAPLRNPTLTLVRQSDKALLKSNDNWQVQDDPADVAAIVASGHQPSDGYEPAIIATLAPGAYTAIVRGLGAGPGAGEGTGIAIVAVYEVDRPDVPLINISTRAKVLTGDNVVIAGFAVGPTSPQSVVISVAGPSLSGLVPNPLENPTLSLVRMSDRTVIATNDDWQVQANPADVALLQASGLDPHDPREPAIITTLQPGLYTAIVSGVGTLTGVAVVSVDQASRDIAITSASNTTFRVGTAGTFTVLSEGFPIATSVTATGALPSGVTFTPGTTTGTISGTPAAGTGGTYTLTITASNGGLTANGTQTFTLTVNEAPAITSANAATFNEGAAGTFSVTATGFPAPTRSMSGALPAGVTFNAATGVLSGTPAAGSMGTYPLVFTAANGLAPDATQNFTLTVTKNVAISSANATTFTVATPGTFTVTTVGTPPATSVTATGALPSGVTFTNNGNTGTLAGTPAAGTGGTYVITITAASGVPPNAVQTFTLTVNQPPAITSANNAAFQVGAAGTHTVTASGFPAPTFSMTGALPAGVTFNAGTGVLSGTPAAGTAGAYPLVVTAANGVGANATQNFTLTVNETVVITSANAATFTVGTLGSFTITTSATPTATSITVPGLPPGLALSATVSGSATISGTPLGPSGVFPLTITASNGGVTPNGTQSFTLTVLAQAQTISFTSAAPASPVANGPTYNVTATATSGLTVALTIDASAAGVCTIAGSTVSFIAGGICVINANQAGDGSYLAAPQVQQSMVVAKATQTVTITSPAPGAAVVAGPTYNVVANAAPSGLAVTFSTSTPGVCSAAGSTISFIGAGTCTVVASQAGNATYDPAQATQSFAVGKASQTISFTSVAPVNATVGGATYGVTATATSGLAVAFTIDPAAAAVCSIAGSTVSFIGAGNCIVNANQAGNANYNAAPQVQQSFAVKSSQTITFTSPAPTNAAVGGPTYTPTATATSGLGVAITIDPSAAAVCSIAGGVVTFNAVGTCVINANQPGDANYFAAPQVQQSFAVNQVPAITSANNVTFNVGTPGTFTVTTTGFPTPTLGAAGTLPSVITFVDNGNGTATLSGTPAAGTAAGSPYALTITAANGVTPNATQSFTLTVTDAAVAVNDSFTVVHDPASPLVVAAPGLLANDTGSPAPTVTSVTGSSTCTAFPCAFQTTNLGNVFVQANGHLTYTPNSNFAGADTFTYIATNSGGSSAPATVTITVTNALPVVDLTGGAAVGIDFTANFSEGGGAVPIVDPAQLTVTDADDTHLTGATIAITNLLDGPSEALAVTCTGAPPACEGTIPLAGVNYNSATGILEILTPAGALLADYEKLLRTLTYVNASANPTLTTRDITVTINDGISDNNPIAHATVTIGAVNNAPVLAAIEAGALSYTVGGAPVAVTSTLTVADADSANLASATVQITANCVGADDVLAFTTQNGISGSYTAGSCLMTLTGSSSPANYQAALRSVTYQNANQATSALTRTVSFRVDDGAAANSLSNIATRNVTIAVNAPPTITAGATLTYFENQAATVMDNTITVVDGDSPNMASATVQITTACAPAEDVLAFTNQNGISGVYTAASCLMTLTGSSTVANYQAALRTVRYSNSSTSPSPLSRTVSWRVNDGAAANNLSNIATSTITITAVNSVPSFTKGADQTVLEDSGPQSVPGWATAISAGPPDEAGQTVTFNVSNNNNALFAAQPSVASNGTLTYTPAANANGSATVTISISDNGGTLNGGVDTSAAQTFTINVTPVNDVPSFTKGGNQTVAEDSGLQTVAGWATAISVGPANEAGQTVTFNVSNDNNALFSGQPAVASNGTLTYTPAANANGLATVSVSISDNGGILNGGVDTSAVQTFTITVTAVNDPPVAIGYTGGAALPAQAGMPITYPPGKLGGSDPLDGTAVTIVTTPDTLCAGCLLTINLDGSFVFTPPPSAAGTTVGFTYHVVDSGTPGPNLSSPAATVAFVVAGPAIYFVKSAVAGAANCTLNNECLFATAATNSAAVTNANIFISDAVTHVGGSTLGGTIRVIGQGVTGVDFDNFFSITPPAQGTIPARPLINQTRPVLGSAGTTLTLGSGNTLQGFNINSSGTALSGTNFGTLTASQIAITSSGTALNLTTGVGAATFDSVASTGGATGITLTGVSGTFALGNGNLTGNTTTALALATSSATITHSGDINPAGIGRPVDIGTAALSSGLTGGTVTLSGRIGNSPASANAIRMRNSTGGTINFSGSQQTLTTSGNNGVELTTNPGATINFSGGNLDITTTSGSGFIATGGGTVNVSGASNTITTTTGTALNVANTTIGTGLTFLSISSNGAANGIVLNTTGNTAGLTVTGDGGGSSNGSGGVIQNSTGIGVSLTSTRDASLNYMNVINGADTGVKGLTLTNFTLNRSNVNTNGNSTADDGLRLGETSGSFVGATGNVTISNTSISGNAHNNVHIRNTSGTITLLSVTNSTFSNLNDSFGANAFLFEGSGTSVLTAATLTGNTFANNSPQRALEVQAHDTATVGSFVVTGNTFSDNGIHASFTQDTSSTLTFTFSNNGTAGTPMGAATLHALNVFSSAVSSGGAINGRIENNFIGNGVTTIGGNGIRALIQGKTVATLLVNNNTITHIGGTSGARGIDMQFLGHTTPALGNTVSDVTLTNNNVDLQSAAGFFPLAAIYLAADNQGSAATVRANVTGNNARNTTTGGGSWDWPSFDGNGGQLIFDLVTAGAVAQLVGAGGADAQLTTGNPVTSAAFVYAAPGVTTFAGPVNTPP